MAGIISQSIRTVHGTPEPRDLRLRGPLPPHHLGLFELSPDHLESLPELPGSNRGYEEMQAASDCLVFERHTGRLRVKGGWGWWRNRLAGRRIDGLRFEMAAHHERFPDEDRDRLASVMTDD